MPGETHPSSLPDLLERAVARHKAGDIATATRLYLEILRREPHHFEALHRLGVARAQAGDAAAAVRHLTAAIAVNPQSAEAHVHLAHARMAAGETEAALASYDQALALRPQYPEALYSRGNALQALQRHAEAVQCYDRALALAPDRPEILTNRGNALHDLKRFDEALASYNQALAIMPGAALLHNNRGNTLRELGRFEEALASLDRALAIAPDYVDALNNRGNTLQDLRRYEEALGSFDRALAQSPGNAFVHYNLGNVLHEIKRYDAALASYDKALAIDPEFSDALNGSGNTLSKLERYEEAAACYEKALAIRPDFEYAAGMLVNARMQCCDWRKRDEEVGRITADIRARKRSITPFMFLGVSDSPQDQLLCSRTWTRDKCPASPVPTWKGERYRHDRIRLAYLSADLHEHVMAYRLAGLFEMHDSARFETIAISFGPDAPGETRTRLKGAFSRFVDVQQRSDREVADLLRELEIDIAVDLNGFTTGCRTQIFALRAAPVQVSYLGYPGTMGADYIDYILADRIVIPEPHDPYYTERVVYLPDTYQVNDSRRVIADRTPTRAEAGLPEQGFVFCSFNNNYKISPPVFDVWMRLLGKVEGSVLWLYESNAAAMRNLKKEAADRGIAPERLVFAPKIKIEDYLARHRLADLALDTLPYNGHGTTSDALWAGLPVLTCLGISFAGRVAASLLNAIGLPELITHSLEEYESLALELARNPQRLAAIKSRLSANRDTYPLFDTDRFRRHIEAAYTTMWERYQRGEPPESFAVVPRE
jgi:predicted O-linked N-acetylglucosamine transferase (SPINDLY family)